jgi:hypothetical protein
MVSLRLKHSLKITAVYNMEELRAGQSLMCKINKQGKRKNKTGDTSLLLLYQ